MKKYAVAFNARRKGALGVSTYYTRIVEAMTEPAARLKLYEEFEHITFHSVRELLPIVR